MAPEANEDLPSTLGKLSINTTELETAPPPRTKAQKKKSSPVADSWEDEVDVNEDDDAVATPVATSSSHAGTSAPPPTPLSPVEHSKRPFPAPALSNPGFTIPPFDGAGGYPSPSSSSTSASGGPSKRPEKTDAVARRMIASALGMRAPKPTEEQRAYDRAVREKERKRREEEKERERKREEEVAKARQAIWDD
ncbi:hypothetical protein N657DRAFT_643102 [Parathielavia appendiculata]|uniref:Uncharacterized protein n=1 Tax=Parathielavia appendiculata TaxID=2587402 RepID=A0AAN6Z6S0_9PEZI|nr:hypothetical protein N657DRAFT_643102 [Parathielavia appendiculata]